MLDEETALEDVETDGAETDDVYDEEDVFDDPVNSSGNYSLGTNTMGVYETPIGAYETPVGVYEIPESPWGKYHPDKRTDVSRSLRVSWTHAEVTYVREWLARYPNLPVRHLYNTIHSCSEARDLFHINHVDLDKLSYIYKKERYNGQT